MHSTSKKGIMKLTVSVVLVITAIILLVVIYSRRNDGNNKGTGPGSNAQGAPKQQQAALKPEEPKPEAPANITPKTVEEPEKKDEQTQAPSSTIHSNPSKRIIVIAQKVITTNQEVEQKKITTEPKAEQKKIPTSPKVEQKKVEQRKATTDLKKVEQKGSEKETNKSTTDVNIIPRRGKIVFVNPGNNVFSRTCYSVKSKLSSSNYVLEQDKTDLTEAEKKQQIIHSNIIREIFEPLTVKKVNLARNKEKEEQIKKLFDNLKKYIEDICDKTDLKMHENAPISLLQFGRPALSWLLCACETKDIEEASKTLEAEIEKIERARKEPEELEKVEKEKGEKQETKTPTYNCILAGELIQGLLAKASKVAGTSPIEITSNLQSSLRSLLKKVKDSRNNKDSKDKQVNDKQVNDKQVNDKDSNNKDSDSDGKEDIHDSDVDDNDAEDDGEKEISIRRIKALIASLDVLLYTIPVDANTKKNINETFSKLKNRTDELVKSDQELTQNLFNELEIIADGVRKGINSVSQFVSDLEWYTCLTNYERKQKDEPKQPALKIPEIPEDLPSFGEIEDMDEVIERVKSILKNYSSVVLPGYLEHMNATDKANEYLILFLVTKKD